MPTCSHLRLTFLASLLFAAACATPPTGGAVEAPDPPPLPPAAAALVREQIAAFDGATGPAAMHRNPGHATAADGRRVAYDRYLLVGSMLGEDRGRAFDRFVDDLTAAGANYFVFHRRPDGRPAKVLLDLDGQRIVATTLQW